MKESSKAGQMSMDDFLKAWNKGQFSELGSAVDFEIPLEDAQKKPEKPHIFWMPNIMRDFLEVPAKSGWACVTDYGSGFGSSPRAAYEGWIRDVGGDRSGPIIKYADHPPLPFIEYTTPEPKRRTFLDWLMCR